MPKKVVPRIINPLTAEIITPVSDLQSISNCRRDALMEVKRITAMVEALDEILAPVVAKAAEMGDKTFMNYWQVVKGATTFNKELFLTKASKTVQKTFAGMEATLKKIKADERFQKEGKPYLKFPRL
jgi:hypothetical protein